jgi:hypothetical protein
MPLEGDADRCERGSVEVVHTLVWKRYGHLYPGSTREAIAALDRHFEALAG